MAGTENQGLTPEDSLLDPDMGFGGEMEMVPEMESMAVHDSSIQPDAEPPLLNEDANAPLDVEPDPEIASDNGFEPELSTDTEAFGGDGDLPQPTHLEAAQESEQNARRQTQRLTVEKQSVTAELESIREENAALKKQLDDVKAAPNTALSDDEINSIKEALTEARTQRNAAETQVKELKTELEAAQVEAENAKAELESSQPVAEDENKIDLMDAQIKSLQADNTQLQEAMKDAQSAESRTEHAHDQLGQRVKDLESKLEESAAELEKAENDTEDQLKENEDLSRKLAVAEKELADNRDAVDDIDKKQSEFADHQAELERVTKALTEARQDNETLQEQTADLEKLKKAVENAAGTKTELEETAKRLEVIQEKLDTESARSYRLSQRRIPALNVEIESAQESVRELEGKLQKSELKSKTLEERYKDEEARAGNLQRALEAAKARAHDTQMISAPTGKKMPEDASQLAEDELRRITNRLHEVEAERNKLADQFREVTQTHSSELAKNSARADRLEVESGERFETLLAQRTDLRLLREKVQGLIKLAEELNRSAEDEKGIVMASMRKVAVLPEEKS